MLDLIILLIILLLSYLWWKDNIRDSKYAPPGPLKFPIIGSLPQMALCGEILPYKAIDKFSETYGPIMTIKLGSVDSVFLTSLEDMSDLLTREETIDRFLIDMIKERNRTDDPRFGIVCCNGPTWKAIRKFCLQNLRQFGFGKKQSMEALMLEEIKELITVTEQRAAESQGIIEVEQLFSLSIINCLWSMIAGKRFSHDDPKLLELVKLNGDIFKATSFVGDLSMAFPILRKYVPWITNRAYLTALFDRFLAFAQEVHDEYKRREDYASNPESFVDIFLAKIDEEKRLPENDRVFTEKQFCSVISELFQAGSETVNGALSYAILLMVLHQDVQKKVQSEIDEVVVPSRDISLEDKSRMIYTQAVIHEILRFGVIAPLFPPRSLTKDLDYKGYRLKKGTQLIPNYYSVAMSKTLWDDPENFRPERFLSEDGKTLINTNKHSPFGFGKRICIGLTVAEPALFLYFTMMLKYFELSIVPGSTPPTTKSQPCLSAIPYPFKMVVKGRY